ncbi:ATP-binding protein [bacterium]|nr:ATP-binding protein [bacterium]
MEWIVLVGGIANFLLGLLILKKGAPTPLKRPFTIFAFLTSLWVFSNFIFLVSHSTFWFKTAYALGALIPSSALIWVLCFSTGKKPSPSLSYIGYGIGLLFFTLCYVNNIFIVGIVPQVSGFSENYGPFFPVYSIYMSGILLYLLYRIFLCCRKFVGVKREQAKYIFLGGATFAIISFVVSFLLPLFGYTKYGILDSPSSLFFVGFTVLAIIQHRLMDINVVITRGTVFAVVYAFVLGIPIAVWFWGRNYLSDKIGVNWGLVPVGMALILASLGPAIYGFIRRKTEAALFKERQRYQENLIALAKQMTLTKDLRQLLVLIIRRVTKEIGISHARIYLLDRKANQYVREVHYGKERRRQFGDSLSQDAPLIQMLYRSRDIGPLLGEEVISHFETSKPEHMEEVKAQLRSMGAAILLPAFIGEELVAFLALGTKRSKQIYTPDDLNMFRILSGQAALAIENAQFYQELKEAQATMLQAAKLSSIGELATGFAHQIDNPLGIISAGCQLCVMDIKDWLRRENLPEEDRKVLEKMEDRMGKVIETAHRGADLVQRIRGYAKPADRDFEPTDLNSIMEDALVLAQYQISQGGVNVTKDIPHDLPRIKGIGVQLEQAFLNMIINACEAMAGKKGELTISARVGKENPDKVEITISDNGRGIPKENLKKIFDIFFTTKGSQGTGVGLSMAYRIIKDHNGDINIESEVGKGTRFTVSLPIWEEKT